MPSSANLSPSTCIIPSDKSGEYTIHFTQQLGSGTFGTVYKGTGRNGKIVAVKQINMERHGKVATNEYATFLRLKNIAHDNIIKIYSVVSHSNNVWAVMDLCSKGDLNKYFSDHFEDVKSVGQKVYIMEEISTGLAFLHGEGIAHRDIKPTNILVHSESGCLRVKLTDFGLARCLDPDGSTSAMSSDAGTFQYKAPEFWKKTSAGAIRYHKSIDIFATGLTSLAILQAKEGEPLRPELEDPTVSVMSDMNIGMMMLIRDQMHLPDVHVAVSKDGDCPMTKSVKKLVQKMTKINPADRPNAKWVLTRLKELKNTKGVLESEVNVCFIWAVYSHEHMCFSIYCEKSLESFRVIRPNLLKFHARTYPNLPNPSMICRKGHTWNKRMKEIGDGARTVTRTLDME